MNRALPYLASVIITNIGNSIHFLVSGKMMYDATGYIAVFAGLIFLEHLKSVLLSAYAGHLTDRLGARKVAIISEMLLGGVVLAVSVASLLGQGIWAVPIGALLLNLLKPFNRTSTFALVRFLAQGDDLRILNARSSAAQQGGYFAGLLLSGLLLAVASAPVLLLVDAASYFLSACCLRATRLDTAGIPEAPRRERQNVLAGIGEVHRTIRKTPKVWALIWIVALLILVIDIYNVCLFKLTGTVFKGQASALPLLEGCYAGGVLLAALLAKRSAAFRVSPDRAWRLFPGVGLLLLGISLSRMLSLTAVFVLVMAILISLIFASLVSHLYESVPSDIIGRIAGLRGAVLGLAGVPLTAATAYAVDSWSLSSGYGLAAIVTAFSGLWAWRQV